LYKEFDVDAYTYTYPEVYTIVEANSKTAINGTYDMLYAGYWTTANDSIEIGDALGKLTIQNVDTEGNYSFKGSFVGTDDKTYKFDQTVFVWAYDDDNEEDIILNENSTAVANIATDNVKVTKVIRKGQLLIQEGDKIYNILGVEMK
jgi:hypothetical protein